MNEDCIKIDKSKLDLTDIAIIMIFVAVAKVIILLKRLKDDQHKSNSN